MTAPSTQDVTALLDRLTVIELEERRVHAAYRQGWADSARGQYEEGYAQAVCDLKAAQHGHVADLAVYLRRWHVCCGPCRRSGHQDGCSRCEDRTRATFGRPHPDDHQAGAA